MEPKTCIKQKLFLYNIQFHYQNYSFGQMRQMCQKVIIKCLDNLVFEISYLGKCASVYCENGIPVLQGWPTCAAVVKLPNEPRGLCRSSYFSNTISKVQLFVLMMVIFTKLRSLVHFKILT